MAPTIPVSRWDTVWVNLDPAQGSEQAGERRPAIVISADDVHRSVPMVLVVPLTKAEGKGRRTYPYEVLVPRLEGGTTCDSIAMPQQVRAISTSRIVKRMGRVRDRVLRERIEDGLLTVLGIDVDD